MSQWRCLLGQIDLRGGKTTLNGHSLDISTLVAIARYETPKSQRLCAADRSVRYEGAVIIDEEASHGVAEGVKFLQSYIDQGHVIYGEQASQDLKSCSATQAIAD